MKLRSCTLFEDAKKTAKIKISYITCFKKKAKNEHNSITEALLHNFQNA